MARWWNGHELTGRHRQGKDIQEVWKFIGGAWRNVWQAVRSCFGRGFWLNDRGWINEDKWSNGK